MIVKKKPVRLVSPLALFTLAGCSPEDYASIAVFKSITNSNTVSVDGNVVKGPLSNSIVFLDYDRNGQLDPGGGEPSIRTGTDGRYTLSTVNKNFNIVAKTDESTVDASSGVVLSGISLTAPAGATVITPLTTLMVKGNLTASQVTEVLGLPSGVDPLNFNPFAAGVDAASALATEKISQQIMSVVNSFAAAAEGAGGSEADAFAAALKSVVEVVKVKAAKLTDPSASAADKSLDLNSTADLVEIKEQAIADMTSVTGVNTTAFDAMANDTATAIKKVNAKIASHNDTTLSSAASKNIFSLTQVLADQVKTAAAAEVVSAGSGSIAFTSTTAVDTAATNSAPTNITLSSSSISEAASSIVIGTLSTTDSDQSSGVAFTYALAQVAGSDYASFSINQATGELSFLAQPDYETKASYSVTILSTDEGGKTFSKTFRVSITDVNEAPSITTAADTSATEDDLYSYKFMATDADTGDAVTYAAPTLPSWLTFDTSTAILSGTPSNSHVGTHAVILTATDSKGAVGTQSFVLTVSNVNDVPTVTSRAVTSIAEDTAYSYTFAASDVDSGDTVTYAATTKPSWLSFNNSSGVLSGTPSNDHIGTHDVTLTATDSSGVIVTQSFTLTVGNVNDAPIVSNPIVDQTFTADLPRSFQFASNVFSDPDADDTLIYTASLSDDSNLPSWLVFDANTRTFGGTPASGDIGVSVLKLTATDGNLTVSDTFNLTVIAEGPLSFNNVIATAFSTTAFPSTEFETSFQLSTVTTKYTYNADTTKYVAPNVYGTETQTRNFWTGDTSTVSNITHLYTEKGTDERVGWITGYDNNDQGIGFEMTSSVALSGTPQATGSWASTLAGSNTMGLDFSWLNTSVFQVLSTTASYVDNYEIGFWVEDANRDGTYEQKGSLLKFFKGTRDLDGGGQSLGAAYHNDLNGETMLYTPAVASEGITFDLDSSFYTI